MTDQAMILWIISVILTVTGLAGLLLPVVPGAPVLFLGLLFAAWAEDFRYIGVWTLLLLAGMAGLTYVVEVVASVLGVKKYGGSPRAMSGFFLASREFCWGRFWGRSRANCPCSGAWIKLVGPVLGQWWDWRSAWRVNLPSVSPWSGSFW